MSEPSAPAADPTRTAQIPLPPDETGRVPVHYDRVQPRYFGVTPPMLLFALAFGGLCVAGFLEVARRKPDTAVARVTADAAWDARARTRAGLEVVGARGRAAREA